MTHQIPHLPKKTATIITVGDSFEATALRSVLENLNFRVTVHWVGSRQEFAKLLSGEIGISDELVVLSCHGIKEGIDMPDEPPFTPEDVAKTAKLQGKTVINLGCATGTTAFRRAFKQAGVNNYIAPNGYPDGSSTIVFAVNLFYGLSKGKSVVEATSEAARNDEQTGLFVCS